MVIRKAHFVGEAVWVDVHGVNNVLRGYPSGKEQLLFGWNGIVISPIVSLVIPTAKTKVFAKYHPRITAPFVIPEVAFEYFIDSSYGISS